MIDGLTEHIKKQIANLANKSLLKDIPLPLLKNSSEFPEISKIIEGHLVKLHGRNELFLPDLHYNNETICVFSDYSGDSPDSLYNTYSFLFAANDSLCFFNNKMKGIRKNHSLDQPHVEIAFKKTNYAQIRRALKDYLTAANNLINGLLLTIIIEKKIKSVIGANNKQNVLEIKKLLESLGYGSWDERVAEKILRITHIISYFVALLSHENQNIFWMTDNDDIIPNKEKANDLSAIWNSIMYHYAPHKYGKISYSAPYLFEDSETKKELIDLLSIPDMIAGSIEQYFTRSKIMEEVNIKEEANKVLMLLTEQGVLLKRMTLRIHEGPNSGWETAIVGFSPKNGFKYFDIEFVPI